MLFSVNQLAPPPTSVSVLESLCYLTEAESKYDPCMVPIKNSRRLDQDMIRLESVRDYVLDSGINNVVDVIHNICEANLISTNKIAFMVNEASLYEDDELVDTASQLLEHGFNVNIAQLSSDNIYYRALDEALRLDQYAETFDESYNLQDYVFNENIIKDGYQKVKDTVSRNVDNMKDFYNDTKKGISNKLAALSKKIKELTAKAKTLTGSAKETINKQINKLKAAYRAAKKKAVSMKNTAVDKVSGAGKFVKDKVSGAGQWAKDKIVGGANYVGDAFGQKKKFV